MEYEIICSVCGRPSHNVLEYRCSSCGQPLDVQISSKFEKARILKRDFSVWRYTRFFPYVEEAEIASLGEGWTPLVKTSDNVCFKLDNLNPTGSFKDRGSTVLISAINRIVKDAGLYISEDSSGNAGASVAAYAARAGLRAKIYVPEAVSGPKFNQIQAYGAEVTKISGSRSRVAEEAQKPEKGKVYVGHILHPLFRDGLRALAYEIAEQFDWQPPDRVYMPVSAGTLLLGVLSGFRHLVDSSVIESVPKVVACQTRQISPLFHRFKGLRYTPPEKITSVADALVSTNPPLLELMFSRLKEAEGDVVMVEEDEIMEAFTELPRRGFFVEPSSAVAYAGYKKQLMTNEVSPEDKIAIILTGNGLKTTTKPVLY